MTIINGDIDDDLPSTVDSLVPEIQVGVQTPPVQENIIHQVDTSLKLGSLLTATTESIQTSYTRMKVLRNIQTEINGTNVVAKQDAALVENYFGGFLGSRLMLEEFTDEPSKTNYCSTNKFINENIAKEVNGFISDSLTGLELVLKTLKENQASVVAQTLPEVVDAIGDMIPRHYDVMEALATTVDTVFPTGVNMFVNIATTPLAELKDMVITYRLVSGPDVSNLFNCLYTYLGQPSIATLLYTRVNPDIKEICYNPDALASAISTIADVNMSQLVTFFRDAGLVSTISSGAGIISDAIDYIESKISVIKDQPAVNPESCNLESCLLETNSTLAAAAWVIDMVPKLNKLIFDSAALFTFLKGDLYNG